MSIQPLHPGDEVMLTNQGRKSAPGPFNPYYGLVIRDIFGVVDVLWDDNVERRHMRTDVLSRAEQDALMRG